jgi:hypothetical protein
LVEKRYTSLRIQESEGDFGSQHRSNSDLGGLKRLDDEIKLEGPKSSDFDNKNTREEVSSTQEQEIQVKIKYKNQGVINLNLK